MDLADGSRQKVEYQVDKDSGYSAKVTYEGGSRKRSSQIPRSVGSGSQSASTGTAFKSAAISSSPSAAQIAPSSSPSFSNSGISSSLGGSPSPQSVFVAKSAVSSARNEAVLLSHSGTPRNTPSQFFVPQSPPPSSGGNIPLTGQFVAAPVNSNSRSLTRLSQNSPQGPPPQTAAHQDEIFLVSHSDNQHAAQSNHQDQRFNTQFLSQPSNTDFVPITPQQQSPQPATNSRSPPPPSSFHTAPLNTQPVEVSRISVPSSQHHTSHNQQNSALHSSNFQQNHNFGQVSS